MDVDKIISELNHALNILDAVENVLVSGLLVVKEELQSTCMPVLGVFPMIVELYEQDKIKNKIIPCEYWPQQLDRIMQVFQEEDYFRWIDVLIFETRGSLEEIPNMLKEIG